MLDQDGEGQIRLFTSIATIFDLLFSEGCWHHEKLALSLHTTASKNARFHLRKNSSAFSATIEIKLGNACKE